MSGSGDPLEPEDNALIGDVQNTIERAEALRHRLDDTIQTVRSTLEAARRLGERRDAQAKPPTDEPRSNTVID